MGTVAPAQPLQIGSVEPPSSENIDSYPRTEAPIPTTRLNYEEIQNVRITLPSIRPSKYSGRTSIARSNGTKLEMNS